MIELLKENHLNADLNVYNKKLNEIIEVLNKRAEPIKTPVPVKKVVTKKSSPKK